MTSDEVTRANTASVFQTLRDIDAMVRAMRLELNTVNSLTANMNERLMLLERLAAEQRIKAMGNGPTKDVDLN